MQLYLCTLNAIEFGNPSIIKLRHIHLLYEKFLGEYNSLVKAAK